ncbi:glycerate kinase [Ruminiclostridium cellobioparum]|uniref:Glycerate kinase n=1 Tax=Ruminiclostridium cellobioparum subsp. termitidis CT1112 TaxID=1195236 RepID=S0FUZ1_RUMCE|nr:glycerate kinase [Ruminiclostridium cellobioparum]EMS74121.1 glycerate kinase [Ruminiclostridium cellobioparum subsp. termitidis CT1112]
MKIVVAPDSFKGNLTALEVAEFIEAGIKQADKDIEVIKIPAADGGEGTVEAIVAATGGKIIKQRVHGPFMEEMDSFFGISGDGKTAVIEMAACSGIMLVKKEELNPLYTTTYGVGELILAARNLGCRKINLGIGGSVTNDGGMGMAQALGYKFYDGQNKLLGQGGKYLCEVAGIDSSGFIKEIDGIEIITACDVNNPLYGPNGAAYIYGPQKGADAETIEFLDQGLRHFAEVIKRDLGKDIADIPGSGAAGGLGGGLLAFLNNARLCSGIDMVISSCNFEEAVRNCDLLITGEGRTDSQTANGKVVAGLAKVAEKCGVPVVCLSGSLMEGYQKIYEHGVDAAFSNIIAPMTLEEAIRSSPQMLTQASYSIARLMLKIYSRAKAKKS